MSVGSSLSGSRLLAASLSNKRSAGSASSSDRPTVWGPLLTPNCPKQSCPEGRHLLLSTSKIPFSCLSSITPAKCSPQKHTLQHCCASVSWSSHSSSTANIPSWSPRKVENIPILMSGLSQHTAGMWFPDLCSCRTDVKRGEEGQKLEAEVLTGSLWACRGSIGSYWPQQWEQGHFVCFRKFLLQLQYSLEFLTWNHSSSEDIRNYRVNKNNPPGVQPWTHSPSKPHSYH